MGAAVFGQDVLAREADARQKQGDQIKFKLAPLSQALQSDQTRLALYADPNDPSKPVAGKEKEYQQTLDNMTSTIGQMRGILGDKQAGANPLEAAAGDALSKLHITNHLKSHVAQVRQQNAAKYEGQNKTMAGEYAQGVPPNELTQYRSQLEGAGYTPEQIDRAMEAKAGIVPKLVSDGTPYKGTDGKWYQNFKDSSGQIIPREMPPGYTGPSSKPIKGPMVRSKQSATGFAQTYLDPTDPNKIVAWQPVTPSRYYQGTTSSSTTTDPFGVTSTTSRTTEPMNQQDVDLSGASPMAPEEPVPSGSGSASSSPTATTPEGPKTKALKKVRNQTPTPAGMPALDNDGHIPSTAHANSMLVEAANQLLDGMDINKLNLPQRDKQAAAELATKYGWSQGTFTPKEKVLLRESATFIDEAENNSALSVLDSPASRLRLAALVGDATKKGVLGSIVSVAASSGASPEEQEFLRMYNQLVGTISGLGQLTRSGRVTEATIGRLMQELPNPLTTQSAEDAKSRLKRLQKELQVAEKQGDFESKNGEDSGDVLQYDPATGTAH